MYKLVVIAGKMRGQEFVLKDGENTLGRDSGNDVHLAIPGVSKKHLMITVTDDVAYVQDMGSSNGTFVNGKMVKSATVKNGDKIALPDAIIQVVHVKEKKVIVKKQVAGEDDDEEDDETFLSGGTPPSALPAKIMHMFKYRLMRFLYGINEEYEWKYLVAIVLAVFVVATISLTILPVIQDSKKLLLYESAKRGAHYADEIARINARALEQRNLEQVDTNFMDNESGVASYELFDLDGRIVRPLGKLNQYIADTFSVQAREWALGDKMRGGNTYTKMLGKGEIGIAQRIMAYNAKTGILDAVGVVAIRFAPKSLAAEATQNSKAYLEALSTSAIVAVIFFFVIYYLTVRPVEEMRFQIEDALRGKRKNVESKYLMKELLPLRNSINSVLQRIKELQREGDDSEFAEAEDDSSYVSTLLEFSHGAGVPVMVLDSAKNVKKINMEAEDLTGIRENAALDMNLLDVAREQGFAATVIELCDNSANNGGTNQRGDYELTGRPYQLHVAALIGRDNFAKAFYITFVKDE